MNRRTFLQAAGAAMIIAALPKTARAGASMDSYFASAFDRNVALVCTNLVCPTTLERADSRPFWYTTFDNETKLTQVSYGRGMSVPGSDYEAVHESGHAFAALLRERYSGDWMRDFLAYHASTIADDDARRGEIFAEHFAAALGMTPYLAYPAYKGLVPFRSAEDTRAWIIKANALCGPIPPTKEAIYAGESADRAEIFWLYPDGSVHRG